MSQLSDLSKRQCRSIFKNGAIALFFKPKSYRLSINQKQFEVDVLPNETLLKAALRLQIDFPHRCRVGGCATCKCQLISGKVKELTDKAYVLSVAELEQGYILACQSRPQSDVSIEVKFHAQTTQIAT